MLIKKLFLIFIFSFVYGCSTTEDFIDDLTAPDYVNSSKAKRLEIPPDLSEIESDNSYSVPGEAKSYVEYLDNEKNLLDNYENPNKKRVITNPEGMKIVKSGNLRWLVVEKEPDIIWPHIKSFWEDLGFRVIVSNKRSGIIETEWMDTQDIKLERKNDGVITNFDKWLDSLSGFADKRKFRTRVEFGENGSTEIYISQRSAAEAADQHSRILKERESGWNPSTMYKIEEYKSDDAKNSSSIEVSEQRELDDYEIDSELLTRLMVKLGSTDFEAKKKVDNPEVIIKAELIKTDNSYSIKMYDSYDRAWRRLGLALDIIGFITEDKNRSDGIYYVRFTEIELPNEEVKEDKGIIDSLIFWDHDEQIDKEDEMDLGSQSDKLLDKNDENNDENNDEKFTGIQAPKVKPIGEDDIPEEFSDETTKPGEEKTWITSLWQSWGDEDNEILPDNEKRYRIRIKPIEENNSLVYIDYSSGKKNNSQDAIRLLTIINEYLK